MIFYKLFSLFAWTIMSLTSVLITPIFLLVWLCTFWWDTRRVAAHMMGTFWAWHYQSIVVYWRLSLDGRNKIPWNRPVVIVSNHRSQVDILSLYKLRRPFKWTSKAENFKLPFVGMVLKLTHAIPIRRESIRSGSKFISRAEFEIKKGSSVLLFPEGTRSKKENMRPFKEGAFLLAKKTGVAIIPVVHTGSQHTFPRNNWIMGPARIRIKVLDEIPAESVKELSMEDLMNLARKRMEAGLAQLEEK